MVVLSGSFRILEKIMKRDTFYQNRAHKRRAALQGQQMIWDNMAENRTEGDKWLKS